MLVSLVLNLLQLSRAALKWLPVVLGRLRRTKNTILKQKVFQQQAVLYILS